MDPGPSDLTYPDAQPELGGKHLNKMALGLSYMGFRSRISDGTSLSVSIEKIFQRPARLAAQVCVGNGGGF